MEGSSGRVSTEVWSWCVGKSSGPPKGGLETGVGGKQLDMRPGRGQGLIVWGPVAQPNVS